MKNLLFPFIQTPIATMKRTLHYSIVLIAALFCAMLAACTMTEAEKQQLRSNAVKNGDTALLGYLTGGGAGAVAGLTAQEIQNIRERQKTAEKQPAAPVTP